jgi:phage shock protein PspC (stress-responsive transcriptional regulator)
MTKKLYRSRDNRMVFGVCGGLGEYFDIDPTIVRLGMIFVGFTCVGILFYIGAGLIIPEEPVNNGGKSAAAGDGFDPLAGAKPDQRADETQAEKMESTVFYSDVRMETEASVTETPEETRTESMVSTETNDNVTEEEKL